MDKYVNYINFKVNSFFAIRFCGSECIFVCYSNANVINYISFLVADKQSKVAMSCFPNKSAKCTQRTAHIDGEHTHATQNLLLNYAAKTKIEATCMLPNEHEPVDDNGCLKTEILCLHSAQRINRFSVQLIIFFMLAGSLQLLHLKNLPCIMPYCCLFRRLFYIL